MYTSLHLPVCSEPLGVDPTSSLLSVRANILTVIRAASVLILGTFQGASYPPTPLEHPRLFHGERLFLWNSNSKEYGILGGSTVILFMEIGVCLYTVAIQMSCLSPCPLKTKGLPSVEVNKQVGRWEGKRGDSLFSMKPVRNSRWPRSGHYASLLHCSREGRIISCGSRRPFGRNHSPSCVYYQPRHQGTGVRHSAHCLVEALRP